MTVKQLALVVAFLIVSTHSFAQLNIDYFIEEGIQHHDDGNYDKALTSYKKALEIDPNSAVVHYEMAYTYFAKGDLEKAIKYADAVLKQDKDYKLQAYLVKGSALDLQGKTKQSIKLFEKAIKTTEGHYLLYYNLGLNYYNLNELDEAEETIIKAIEINPNHASSHLILAYIHDKKGNRVQSLLASHYFLLLEPASNRSAEAYAMLRDNYSSNVTKDPNNPKSININLAMNNTGQFNTIEMMLALMEASKSTEANEGKTEDEMFIENTTSFFKFMGESKKKRNKEIWWSLYSPFFYKLAQSEHMETYCHYISQSGNEPSKVWLDENEAKLLEFSNWLENNSNTVE